MTDELLLSTRAHGVLRNMNLTTKEQVIEAIKSLKLHPSSYGCRNMGKKTFAEIIEWVGGNVSKCPHCNHILDITLK